MADGIFSVDDHIVLMLLTILGGLLAFVSIFLFKKRTLQLKIGYLVIVASIMLVFLAIVLFMNDSSQLSDKAQIDDRLGLYLPVISIVMAFLANRYIKKDESIVKSMDRLR